MDIKIRIPHEGLPHRVRGLSSRRRLFRLWQRRPYRYAPMPEYEQWHCANCGESFDGNYCPRCGQPGLTRRLTMRNAVASAFDVWGLGGKSMPRTWLHLLLRPGYMMADYIRGHRQPYFPPFKMLFLTAALFAILIHSVRFFVTKPPEPDTNSYEAIFNEIEQTAVEVQMRKDSIAHSQQPEAATATREKPPATTTADESKRHTLLKAAIKSLDDNEVEVALIITFYTSVMCRLQFRRRSRIPHMTLTEHFIAHVMIQSQLILISIPYFLLSLLWVQGGDESIPWYFLIVVFYIDYHQLYGYGRWATLWRIVGQAVGSIALQVIILLLFLIGVMLMMNK